MTFKTSDEALRHCDKYKACQGVAIEGDSYFAVEKVTEDKRKQLVSIEFDLFYFSSFSREPETWASYTKIKQNNTVPFGSGYTEYYAY